MVNEGFLKRNHVFVPSGRGKRRKEVAAEDEDVCRRCEAQFLELLIEGNVAMEIRAVDPVHSILENLP